MNIPFKMWIIFLVFRGLLGGHSVAIMLKEKGEYMQWYNGELLHMAKELGYKLLPAFNTTSGLPYPRVSSLISAIQEYFCKQNSCCFVFISVSKITCIFIKCTENQKLINCSFVVYDTWYLKIKS